MAYDIQVQFLPNGQMLLYESKSGSSVIMAEEAPYFLYMVYCDTGSNNAIEYPLLKEFFLTAHQEFQLARLFGASYSGEKEENKKSYSGCMLGVDWANKLNVEAAIEKNGGQWIDNITQDELYIIVGKDLSDVDVKVIDSLKGKWHKAKIFTVQGFLHFINTGRSDDDLRKDFNNFIKHCVFAADGYFKWPHTNTYPGAGIFNATKELLQIGVLAAMGYHVGSKGLDVSSRHKILQNAYITAVPFVEIDNMKEWNAPKTPWRLKKIADCLATFTKNAKRRSNSDSFWQAIEDWESDLAWLKRNFYDGVYNSKFVWPNWNE